MDGGRITERQLDAITRIAIAKRLRPTDIDAMSARTFNRNPEFYAFYRSLQAYRNSLGKETDVIVISPDSDFFKYLNRPQAR